MESCNLLGTSIRFTLNKAEQHDTPLSHLIRGTRAKTEIAVGIPMMRPEKVSPPPNRSVYAFEEGTIIGKEI